MDSLTKCQKAGQFVMGATTTVKVDYALKCVSNRNPLTRLWYKIFCLLKTGTFVNQARLTKALQETDLPTLQKISRLYEKAERLATTEPHPEKYLKMAKHQKIFLDLLQEELLSKFTGQDANLLSICRALPDEKQKLLMKLAKLGITASFIVASHPENKDLKTCFETENFVENLYQTIQSLLSSNDVPPVKDVVGMLDHGLFEIIQKQIKTTTPSEDLIKAITFSDQTILAASKPTNEEELANIFKTALKKSSHLVILGYPDFLNKSEVGVERQLGNSTITLNLDSQEFIPLDSQDKQAFAIKTKFKVIDSDGAEPTQRMLELLTYPNWTSENSFKLNEMTAFVELDRKMGADHPLIIGDQLDHTGTYITLRQTLATSNPLVPTLRQVGNVLGKTALPRTVEEMASMFACLANHISSDEFGLLNPLRTMFTVEEAAKQIFKINHPGVAATPEQLETLTNELKLLGFPNTFHATPQEIKTHAMMLKNRVFSDKIAVGMIMSIFKAHGINLKLNYIFTDLVEKAVTQYAQRREKNATMLAKQLYPDLAEEALIIKKNDVISILGSLLIMELPSDFHYALKELLEKQLSTVDLAYFCEVIGNKKLKLKFSNSIQTKINNDQLTDFDQFMELFLDPKVFHEIVDACIANKKLIPLKI